MMKELEQVARSYHIKTVYGFTQETNGPATSFYTRLGYDLILVKDYYGETRDGFMFCKRKLASNPGHTIAETK